MRRAGTFSGKLLLVFWATLSGTAIGGVPNSTPFNTSGIVDGSGIQAIDGSGIQAIDGSGIQAIDGSGTRVISVDETRTIDAGGIHGIYQIFKRFWIRF